MNTETQKAGSGQAVHVPAVVDLRDRVPALDDKALATLHTNALRLKETGTTRQRASAEDLLPVIESELAERRKTKRAEAPAKPARAVKAKKAKTAKAVKTTKTAKKKTKPADGEGAEA